ncbi:hypothetical protein DCAR_0102729 [Daucus carota subsp. sativus]|uniref:GRAM domain-containing protein n=1 Tax=Daucus carota subsp. sativus TaxID=79200 RepID=A0AAF0W8D6_DAUCS|nr:hypothetical protein DCAR_0102729 [Daucus carota subsp. sativus]
MKNQILGQVIGIPVSSAAYPAEMPQQGILCITSDQYYASPKFRQSKYLFSLSNVSLLDIAGKMDTVFDRMNQLAKGIREHVKIGPKLSETVKGKLRLGARILQVGGVKKVFKQNFSFSEGEKLLKASQCYLYTTAGPIAGLLFISTDRIAFCSERSMKVSIPLNKIKRANESENMKDPSRKYIDIVTKDDFEFWFMGFLNHQRTYKFLQQAVYESQ